MKTPATRFSALFTKQHIFPLSGLDPGVGREKRKRHSGVWFHRMPSLYLYLLVDSHRCCFHKPLAQIYRRSGSENTLVSAVSKEG